MVQRKFLTPRPGEDSYLDEIAIERAVAGERLPLTVAETREVARRLARRGISHTALARILGCGNGNARRLLDEVDKPVGAHSPTRPTKGEAP